MITITPQGNIYLCKTPLERDYKNQLTFSSLQSQTSYFNGRVQKSYDNYTYVKKDNFITVGTPIDEIMTCNYLFYKNTGFTNKTYYCFITKMEYINENATRIYFESDVFQTYQFDIVYNPSFIEREHVNNDTVGLHTVPEGLETGEYKVTQRVDGQSFGSYMTVIVGATIDFNDKNGNKYANINGSSINGVYNGVRYFVPSTIASLNLILKDVADAGQSDAITTIFMGDLSFCELSSGAELYPYIVDSTTAMSKAWEYAVIDQGEMPFRFWIMSLRVMTNLG